MSEPIWAYLRDGSCVPTVLLADGWHVLRTAPGGELVPGDLLPEVPRARDSGDLRGAIRSAFGAEVDSPPAKSGGTPTLAWVATGIMVAAGVIYLANRDIVRPDRSGGGWRS
jgi:hypothetical protein